MRVLIAETDQQLARARRAAPDGRSSHTTLALSSHAAALKLAELPDALLLCDVGSPVQTIALLCALRGGENPGQRLGRHKPGKPRGPAALVITRL